MTSNEPRICRRCGRPVEFNRDRYSLFEGMHELCFHLEFEHPGDPDVPCDVPGCPVRVRLAFEAKLRELGQNPGQVLLEFGKSQARK